jgi:uncharacterized protein
VTVARRPHVLIAGVTTRAPAVSAARAGYRVTAVDTFGDMDLRRAVEVITLRRESGAGYGPHAAVTAGAGVPADLVAYTSNFENYPRAVARLAQGRGLLGNSPEVLARVRNPLELMRVLRGHGFASPDTRLSAPGGRPTAGAWLLKPRRSGGGHGITVWQTGAPVPRGAYLQERIAGVPGSLTFAADGHTAACLGFSRQLEATSRFGTGGFRYCGSLLGTPRRTLFPRQSELVARATEAAAVLTRQFQLVGLNGLDFIARDGVPYILEVNPRYSASMELIERAQGVSMFEVHARACCGVLPPIPHPAAQVHGKAIVFARRDVILGDTRAWEESPSFADVPHLGESIQRGHPICTVFARAADGKTCRRRLLSQAAAVYRTVEARKRQAA